LSSAVPDPLTLTSFSIGRDGGFELEAMVVGPGFNPDDTRKALARCGLTSSPGDGWVFDAASRKLAVRGTYRGTKP
jgi:hypothetical protein